MTDIDLNCEIDCEDLTSHEINFKVKELMFNGSKNVILDNTFKKHGLLNGLKGGLKVEVLSSVGDEFACALNGPRVIVTGDVGDYSASCIEQGKVVVFGSCGNYFAAKSKSCQLYVYENCGIASFNEFDKSSSCVVGGLIGNDCGNNGGTIINLNLKGGTFYLEDNFFAPPFKGVIYFRGSIKPASTGMNLEKTTKEDEDVLLPLISEFSRLFKFSLSEIKSKEFHKVIK